MTTQSRLGEVVEGSTRRRKVGVDVGSYKSVSSIRLEKEFLDSHKGPDIRRLPKSSVSDIRNSSEYNVCSRIGWTRRKVRRRR